MRFQIVFLGVVALLLLGALGRWARTPTTHPAHQERGEMVYLLLLMLAGQGLVMFRERFELVLPVFWGCSIALLAVAVGVMLLLKRLFRAYRKTEDTAKSAASVSGPPYRP